MTHQWVERYTYAVVNALPEAQRADIEKELRSLIEDMLEARTQGRVATDQDTEAVLLELGDPARLADTYRGHRRYLIGPDLYPTYLTVLKIVLGAITIAMTVVFVIQTVLEPEAGLNHLTKAVASMFMGWLQGFAWVTVSLGVTEFVRERQGAGDGKPVTEWKPSQLPQRPERELRIGRADPIAAIIFTVLFVVVLTFALDVFGIWVLGQSRPGVVVSFLNEDAFRPYLPFVWIASGLAILNEIAKLIAGRWSLRLVALDVVVDMVNFALALALFTNPAIWNPDFVGQLAQSGLVPAGSEAFRTLSEIWAQVTRGIGYLVGFAFAVELIKALVLVIRVRRRVSAAPAASAHMT